MKCFSCGKKIDDEPVAFCEKCEKYYCMDCCHKHINHGIIFFRNKNDSLQDIDVGVSGAGGGDIHEKFYEDTKWILSQKRCSHAIDKLNEYKPLFFCEDGIIRCPDCFFNSNVTRVDPILKLTDKDKFMWLIPCTYNPYNLKFDVECVDTSIKGHSIDLKIFIENNREYSIKDIEVTVEAFANDVSNYWWDADESKCLILTKVHMDSITPGKIICLPLQVRVPLDGEIKENDFIDFSFTDEYYEFPSENKKLNVPDILKLYSSFSYKSCTGFEYYSYVECNEIKLK